MKNKLFLAYFLLSFMVLAYAYGVVSVMYGLFPYNVAREAVFAYKALKANQLEEGTDLESIAEKGADETRAVNHANLDDGQLFLIGGGPRRFPVESGGKPSLAWLINRKGEVLYEWKYDPADVWGDIDHVTGNARPDVIQPIGFILCPNFDLLVTFTCGKAYPFGIGLARFDRDGNLLWKKADYYHHWLTTTASGDIYATALRDTPTPYKVGNSGYSLKSPDGRFYEDVIRRISPQGEVLAEKSVPELLVESGYIGLLVNRIREKHFDPTHLNYVVELSEEMAPTYPKFTAGDVLISLRELNTIMVLDPATWKVKWSCTGLFHRQHSPVFDGRGGILVFDNRGGEHPGLGRSQIVRVDVATGQREVLYPTGASHPGFEFFSHYSGAVKMSPDGRRCLTTISEKGRVVEFDAATGETLWEYFVTQPLKDGRRGVFTIHSAGYVSPDRFTITK